MNKLKFLKKLNIFGGYFTYLKIYTRYTGKHIFFLYFISFISVTTDSIGLMMLFPLLKFSDISTSVNLGTRGEFFLQILRFFHLPESQVGVILLIGIIFIIKGIIKFCQGGYSGYLTAKLKLSLQSRLLNNYTNMEYIKYSSKNTGHYINIINSQTEGLISTFLSHIQFSIQYISTAVYLFFAMFLSWKFTLMSIVAGVIIMFFLRILIASTKNFSRKTSRETGELAKLLIQVLQTFKYLKSTGSIDSLKKKSIKSMNNLASFRFKLSLANSLMTAINEPLTVLLLVIILLVQLLIYHQSIIPLIVTLLLLNRAMNAIIALQSAWQKMMNNIGGLEMTVNEFKEVKVYEEISRETNISSLGQGIEFHNVSFSYTQNLVLKNINMHIPQNSTVALVGESGSGKSTLVDLITLLLKPNKGYITINGVPHTNLNFHDWRRHIGFVTQESVIFDDTISNNISLWSTNPMNDKNFNKTIRDAAEQAYIKSFIENLPEQYNTIVGDRGVKLSGGQRQRICIARELFKKPQLLILDEATSALDTESEKYIQKSIDDLKGKMTVVIIAHRLSTIKSADFICVLAKGEIVESGTYKELISYSNGKFRNMVELQTL